MRALILSLLLLLAYPSPLAQDHVPAATQMVSSRGESRVMEMEVTAYTSSDEDCGKHDGITATGTKAGLGTVASDWSVLRPGTRVYVPGYGMGVVADKGGAITGNKLDVWLPSKKQTLIFGRQHLKVRILGD